jgi:hypothetical protein
MRKFKIGFFILLVLVFAGCSNSKYNDYKFESSTGGLIKQFSYEKLEDIENMSDVIIKATFTGERKQKIDRDSEGHTIEQLTSSDVKIQQIYKGDVEKGDIISVIEPVTIEDNHISSVLGYNMMNKKGTYLLFLDKIETGEYIVSGIYLGKYDLTKGKVKKVDYIGKNYETIQGVEYVGDEVEKFNKFKEKAIEKYGEK